MRSLFIIGIILMTFINDFSQQHDIFTKVLKKYVKNSLVDYKKLQKDNEFQKYLDFLSKVELNKLNHDEKLAFWINAYNAFTLKVIIDNYPVESIIDLHSGGKIIGYLLGKTVWDKKFIAVNRTKMSLGEIEHEILRKQFKEPRIHFAIVCASISCPELRNEAYESEKIDAQLEEQTIKFLNDKTRNHFDLKKREAHLSKIFDWYKEDFGKSDENILRFTVKYLPNNIGEDIIKNIFEWDISYKSYNWNLNKKGELQ